MYKKRQMLSLICLVLIFSVISPPVSAIASGTITIAVEELNVREGPGLSYKVLKKVQKGENFPLVKSDGDWYQVDLGSGKKGWIANWLVTKKESVISGSGNGIVSTNSLRVRTGPGTSFEVAGSLHKNDKVEILNQDGDWLEVNTPIGKGWVSKEYIQTKSEKSTGKITASSLNVRNSNSLDGKVIASISKGETFKIVEEQDNWIRIELGAGKDGWVAGWYLEKTVPKNTPSNETIKNSSVTIEHDGTNIRSSADTNSKVLARANSGDSFPIVAIHNDWYEIKLTNGKNGFVAGWIVSVSGGVPQVEKPGMNTDLKSKKIMIDPGHGGRDNGATGFKGTLEKQITLRTGQLLFSKLRAKGANVILTRSNDQYLSLGTRVSMAHYQDVDAFISIHYDSIENSAVNGMTTYYYHPYQKALATAVHKAAQNQVTIKDRNIRFGNYHVIRENRQQAILLELGYLSNPEEESLINSNQYQDQITNGIVQGLASYFN
jgi:N-acetylmuramoyl-L-alanine amidase